MQKRMEVDMLDNTQRKDANCKVINHKLSPKCHFMEYKLRKQRFCCNPIWFEMQLFALGLTWGVLTGTPAPFSCKDSGMVKPKPVPAPAVSSGFCVTLGHRSKHWRRLKTILLPQLTPHRLCCTTLYWTRTSCSVNSSPWLEFLTLRVRYKEQNSTEITH